MSAPLQTISPVLMIGSMAFDDLELPSGTYNNVVGGAADYAALAASYFTKVRIVGVIGEDFDQNFLKILENRGVDLAGVESILGGKTFRWKGRYAADLQSRETLDTQLNVFADFNPKVPSSYMDSPYVLLGNIHPSLQLQVLSELKKAGSKPKLIALDTMNFWISGEPKLLAEVLKQIDLLVINDEEARDLSGERSLKMAAEKIKAMGPKKLIIKKGEHGAMLFDSYGTYFVPGILLDHVLDPTGAGDSFAGGLLGYLAANDDGSEYALRRAVIFGSVMGSFCVEGVGTSKLTTLTHSGVIARAKEFLKMLDHGDSEAFLKQF